MVSVQARVKMVALAQRSGLSSRRACALLQVSRSMLYYQHRQPCRDKALAKELRDLSKSYPRWGYRLMRNKLQSPASYGRVYRIWRSEGLALPRKRKSKRLRGNKHRWMSAIAPNSIWAYDFVFDACANGQKLKCLTLIDEWTRECLAIIPEARIRSAEVINALSRLFAEHGSPAFIRSDNGPEFIAQNVQNWLKEQGVQTTYIQPGKPWQNGVIESFNARFRADCLDVEWFNSRREAKWIIENWRKQYNEQRPHSGIQYEIPTQKRKAWKLEQLKTKKRAA